jgi:hypothetical protein
MKGRLTEDSNPCDRVRNRETSSAGHVVLEQTAEMAEKIDSEV